MVQLSLYLDDITVVGTSFKEHLGDLGVVLRDTAKPDKVQIVSKDRHV